MNWIWKHVNLHGEYDFDIEINTDHFNMTDAKSLNVKQIQPVSDFTLLFSHELIFVLLIVA